jgi:hypothetical protein
MTPSPEFSRELLRPLVAAICLGIGAAHAADRSTGIVVNTVPLTDETVQALQRIYPVPIQPGRYWYDAVSGAYGLEGGPIAGQMLPGLRLGGPLRADASRGTSGVFINGRQLTFGEKSYLEQTCHTPVVAGRYCPGPGRLRGPSGQLQPGAVRGFERAERRPRFEHANVLQPGRFVHLVRLVGVGAYCAKVKAIPRNLRVYPSFLLCSVTHRPRPGAAQIVVTVR